MSTAASTFISIMADSALLKVLEKLKAKKAGYTETWSGYNCNKLVKFLPLLFTTIFLILMNNDYM